MYLKSGHNILNLSQWKIEPMFIATQKWKHSSLMPKHDIDGLVEDCRVSSALTIDTAVLH